jgi:hypothetical protein
MAGMDASVEPSRLLLGINMTRSKPGVCVDNIVKRISARNPESMAILIIEDPV